MWRDLTISVTAHFWSQQVKGVQGQTIVTSNPGGEVGIG